MLIYLRSTVLRCGCVSFGWCVGWCVFWGCVLVEQGGAMRHQRGFTLIELLVAMVVVLVVIVAVQRYVAGVLVDRDFLSAQQDQLNQVQVVLSNLQSDVGQAGFVPVASAQVPLGTENAVGLKVRACSAVNCVGDELWVAYWTQEDPAYDCLNNKVLQARVQGWVRVESVYQFRRASSSGLVLGCDGNGGAKGGDWAGFTRGDVGDVFDFGWQLQAASTDGGQLGLLSLCMNTRLPSSDWVMGGRAAQSCTTSPLPSGGSAAYQFHTVQLDFVLRPQYTGVVP